MLAQLSHWVLILTIGQAATEADLLKAAPADVDVAVRVRGLEAVRGDVVDMLKSMDPDWGNMAEGAVGNPLDQVRAMHGAHAVKSPLVALVRLGEAGGEGGPPPFAILMPSDDYKASLKEFMGGNDVELKHQQDGDYDAFDGPGGHGTWYAAKGPGIVAFGTSKGLIADIAKKPGKTLASVLTGPAFGSFSGGDIGVYVNAASLTQRYSEQIDQGRQMLMGVLDQAGQQAGNATTMKAAKELYAGLFDSLKYADGLTLHFDVAAKGLHLAGFLKVKPDSDAAKGISQVRSDELAALGKLPAGAMAYTYMNVGARTFDRLKGMSLKMMTDGDKPSPALEKALADLHAAGRIETVGSVTLDKGMVSFNAMKTEDPRGFIEKRLAILRAMAGGQDQSGLFKEVKVQPDAQTYKGMGFTHATSIINMEKLAEMSGNNPAQLESMKRMFAGGHMESWFGTDGKDVLEIAAPTWDAAKALIDAYTSGQGGVGSDPGFKAVVSELPGRASFLMVMNVQGLVKMMANQFAAMKNADIKAPEGMPKEAAYLGAAVTPHSAQGYGFHLVIPSQVGTVIGKGLIPLFQGFAAANR